MNKPDYKNWVPEWLILALGAAAVVCGILFYIFGYVFENLSGGIKIALMCISGVGFIFFAGMCIFMTMLYRAFSYKGDRKMSKQIIEGIAEYVTIPDGGKGLDVGCGSGALTIACAKRNLNSKMVGLDRWGKEYKNYSRALCRKNAEAEGINNVEFVKGDALKLDFPDETFDVVTSNYVYHNIKGYSHQELLKETLRVLKKGGTFAIHDIMSKMIYGDMNKFMEELKREGYERVELIDTTNGMFMSPKESKLYLLSGSSLLIGKK
ncbi:MULTISPECIES: class I SAM-dependent methyltransferase [Peptoniphilus]|uniref:class I SAM-dependent methyltransferase n=1 Tax=Peptoniphilus TaxID=162289 RepID=UPI0001DA9D61|nr:MULTISPECIES: class I SAM-dependent methyltransferase [Peptoniphilus]EFI42505.1 methyltransferase domain protein [Peptoniphilus sp. oral taxon 386 str. F0131]